MGQRTFPYDNDLLLKDAGLVAASAAAQVSGSNKILDVGAARIEGTVVIDMTAIETDSSNEVYDIILQGSNSSSFASTVENLCQKQLGHSSVLDGGAQTSTTGRYELPFTNEADDVTYRYLRLYTKIAGTIGTGINYKAFIALQPGSC